MKNLTSLFATALIALVTFSSCSTGTASAKEESSKESKEIAVYQIDDVLTNGDKLIGQEIELEGVCTHICKHGGRKIFLMGSSDKYTLRIESGELGKFDQKCVNSIVKVKGTLVEEKIDEAYLQKWEETVKQQTADAHGDGEAGCSTEKKARGETANSPQARIDGFRQRIAEQKEKNGKDYLSFYHISAKSYEIQ